MSTEIPNPFPENPLLEKIRKRRFDQANQLVEPVPRFFVNGKVISTPGNLTNVIAQAKAGKTAFIGAIIAARLCAIDGTEGRDTLGVTASNLPGIVLWLDTEQATYDHDQQHRRALRRAGVETSPDWLESYSLAGMSAQELREGLKLLLQQARQKGAVIYAVLLDGTADLVVNVNDEKECNPFVAELQALAMEYDCPIINVVHENPGQEGGKMRGHLGSQLERKAESNLRLKKVENITTVFSEKMRKAPILEKDGPRFEWDDAAGMHVSVETKGAVRLSEKGEEVRDLAMEVFGQSNLRWSEAMTGIEKAKRVGAKAAEKWFKKMKDMGAIKKVGMGLWAQSHG